MRLRVPALRGSCAVILLTLIAAGCTSSDHPDSQAGPVVPTGSAEVPSQAGEYRQRDLRRIEALLTPTPATTRLRRPQVSFKRSGGNVLVVEQELRPRVRTLYRIFDEEWLARSPILELGHVGLNVLRAVDGGWLILADRTARNGRVSLQAHAVIRDDGSLVVLDEGSSGAPTRPGDELFLGADYRPWAYRPSTGLVWQAARPDWAAPGRMYYLSRPEPFCTGPYHSDKRMATRCTSDNGRTWHSMMLADALPDGLPTVKPVEYLRAGRLVVGLGPSERLTRICVLDLVERPPGADLLGCSRPPNGGDRFHFTVLPDGSTVFRGERGGVFVATDPLNERFEHRRTPGDPQQTSVSVDGDDLVAVDDLGGSRGLWVSDDRARTWRRVTLAPSP